jgi:hypothetical protein
VVDDWPECVPVTRAEIDVLETFLGRLLDQVLATTLVRPQSSDAHISDPQSDPSSNPIAN